MGRVFAENYALDWHRGYGGTAQDTVPFCLWCAAYFYISVEEALWTAVSALGDRDTICAIVGGMVSLFADELPQQWLSYMEDPEKSVFLKTKRDHKEETIESSSGQTSTKGCKR